MQSSVRTALAMALAVTAGVTGTVLAQRNAATAAKPAQATAQIVAAAQALLATLDEAGRTKVQFPFDGPQKARWSNFPSGALKREGLRLGDLTATQRTAAMTLVQTALSTAGYQKVRAIMRGDEMLRQNEATNGPDGGRAGRGRGRGMPGGGMRAAFGEDEYYLAFVGTPSTTDPWMLQFGGHHLAINLTMGGSEASLTPSTPRRSPQPTRLRDERCDRWAPKTTRASR